MATQLGWPVTSFEWQIVAGVDASERLSMVVTAEDGSALPTYEGWSCELVLISPYTNRSGLTLAPEVSGDSGTKTLSAVLNFDAEQTGALLPGIYTGAVFMTDPTDGSRHCPATINLLVR